jgi:hypothetical protein
MGTRRLNIGQYTFWLHRNNQYIDRETDLGEVGAGVRGGGGIRGGNRKISIRESRWHDRDWKAYRWYAGKDTIERKGREGEGVEG